LLAVGEEGPCTPECLISLDCPFLGCLNLDVHPSSLDNEIQAISISWFLLERICSNTACSASYKNVAL